MTERTYKYRYGIIAVVLVIAFFTAIAIVMTMANNDDADQKPLKEVFENGRVEVEIGEYISEFSLERIDDGIIVRGNQVQVYYEPEKGKCTSCTISGDFFTEKLFPCNRKIQKIIVI